MADLKSLVRSIPDYPKKGILFRDITTLIEDPEGFRQSIEEIAAAHRPLGSSCWDWGWPVSWRRCC